MKKRIAALLTAFVLLVFFMPVQAVYGETMPGEPTVISQDGGDAPAPGAGEIDLPDEGEPDDEPGTGTTPGNLDEEPGEEEQPGETEQPGEEEQPDEEEKPGDDKLLEGEDDELEPTEEPDEEDDELEEKPAAGADDEDKEDDEDGEEKPGTDKDALLPVIEGEFGIASVMMLAEPMNLVSVFSSFPEGTIIVEAEDGSFSGNCGVSADGTFDATSGTGRIRFWGAGSASYSASIPAAGKYDIVVYSGSMGSDTGRVGVFVNGTEYYALTSSGTTPNWEASALHTFNGSSFDPKGALSLPEGTLSLTLDNTWQNGNWLFYDYIALIPVYDGEAVDAMIDALPGTITLADATQVQKIYGLYLSLDTTEQANVTKFATLMVARARIAALTTDGSAEAGLLRYELEDGTLGGDMELRSDPGLMPGFSGTGYTYMEVASTPGSVTLDFYVPATGDYHVYVVAGSHSNDPRCEKVEINTVTDLFVSTPANTPGVWHLVEPGVANGNGGYLPPDAGFALTAGKNTIKVLHNNGWGMYDAVVVVPATPPAPSLTPAEVDDLITALPAWDAVTLADETNIKDAMAEYLALSGGDKAQVTQYTKLLLTNARLDALLADVSAAAGVLRFELEYAALSGGAAVSDAVDVMTGFTGTGFVALGGGNASLPFAVPTAGQWKLSVVSGTDNSAMRCDNVTVNGLARLLQLTAPGTTSWQTQTPSRETYNDGGSLIHNPLAEGYYLAEGRHTFALSANWGGCNYDAIVLEPMVTDGISVEAESGTLSGSGISNGDGHFASMSGSSGIRFYEAAGQGSYMVNIPTAGNYRIYAYTGSIEGDERYNEFTIEGVTYRVRTPAGTAPGWHKAGLETFALGSYADAGTIALPAGNVNFTFTGAGGAWLYCDRFVFVLDNTDPPATPLTAAEVDALIAALPEVNAVTLANEAAVLDAYLKYNTLPAAEQAKVTRFAKLMTVNARLNALKADPSAAAGVLRYELEYGMMQGNTAVSSNTDVMQPYSGTGYVFLFDASMFLEFYMPEAGNYRLKVVSGSNTDDGKCDYVSINGGDNLLVYAPAGQQGVWQASQPGTEAYEMGSLKPAPPEEGFALVAGKNTFALSANWGYACYDAIIIEPFSTVDENALENAAALLAALPWVDDVTLAHSDIINDAWNAWRALTVTEQAQLGDVSLLWMDRARLDALTADPNAAPGVLRYELEYATLWGNTGSSVDTSVMQPYSGSGYVYLFDAGLTLNFYMPRGGLYNAYVIMGNNEDGDKCDYTSINAGGTLLTYVPKNMRGQWYSSVMGRERYSPYSGRLDPIPPIAGFTLYEGKNTFELTANWGYACYDALVLVPSEGNGDDGFYTPGEVEDMAACLPDDITLANADQVKFVYNAYLTLLRVEQESMPSRGKLLIANARINALLRNPNSPRGTLLYELEEGRPYGNTARSNNLSSFKNCSGWGYVFLFDQHLEMDIFVPTTGQYSLYIISGLTEPGDKCDYVSINGGEPMLAALSNSTVGRWRTVEVGDEFWENDVLYSKIPGGGVRLNSGSNLLELSANWGYCAYDAVIVSPGAPPLEEEDEPEEDITEEDLEWEDMETVDDMPPAVEPGTTPSEVIPDETEPTAQRSAWPIAAGVGGAVVLLGGGLALFLGLRRKRNA